MRLFVRGSRGVCVHRVMCVCGLGEDIQLLFINICPISAAHFARANRIDKGPSRCWANENGDDDDDDVDGNNVLCVDGLVASKQRLDRPH